jgi:hypothetical protein
MAQAQAGLELRAVFRTGQVFRHGKEDGGDFQGHIVRNDACTISTERIKS